jgi:hypothetical protein
MYLVSGSVDVVDWLLEHRRHVAARQLPRELHEAGENRHEQPGKKKYFTLETLSITKNRPS